MNDERETESYLFYYMYCSETREKMNHHHHHHRLVDAEDSEDSDDDDDEEFYKKRRRRRLDVVVFTYRWIIIQTIFVIIGLCSFVFVHQRKNQKKRNNQILPIPSNPIYGVNNQTTQSSKQQQILLPNVLLVGAQKAGTTSIAEWLFTNANVCRPKVFNDESLIPYNKEVHFFDNRYKTNTKTNTGGGSGSGSGGTNDFTLLKENIEFYTRRYQHCLDHNLVMDATPDYLDKATLIRQFYDRSAVGSKTTVDANLKIIIILREPISRELSLYNHLVNEYLELKEKSSTQNENEDLDMHWSSMIVKEEDKSTVMSFEEHVEEHLLPCIKPTGYKKKAKSKNKKKLLFTSACYLPKGGYATLLKEWFGLFDRKQILILSYDELKTKPSVALQRIVIFLGLENIMNKHPLPAITNENTQTSASNSKKYKTVKPTCIVQERLSRIYNQWNNDLYDLLENNQNQNQRRLSIEQQPFPKFQLGDCQFTNNVT